MCFSASASFIAGTSLCAVGVATVKRTEARTELPFAMIPMLFGIQQLTEGVIWLTFSHDAPVLKQTMTYLYSGYSHVLWPMYVPFAMGFMDVVRRRKKAIFAFEAVGVAVGFYLLYFIVARPVVAEVVGRHIVYVSPHFYLRWGARVSRARQTGSLVDIFKGGERWQIISIPSAACRWKKRTPPACLSTTE